MKIVRGQYKPLPQGFTPGLRALVASTLRTDPGSRPTVVDILQNPLVQNFVRSKPACDHSIIKGASTDSHISRKYSADCLPQSPRPGLGLLRTDIRITDSQDDPREKISLHVNPSAPSVQSKHTDLQQPVDWMADMHARIGAVKDTLLQAPQRRQISDHNYSPTTPAAPPSPSGIEGREAGIGKWDKVMRQDRLCAQAVSPSDMPRNNSRVNARTTLSPRPGDHPCSPTSIDSSMI